MEELGPFLFFIFIALVQLVKFLIEKSAKAKSGSIQPAKPSEEHKPSGLEAFFQGLAEKLELQPQPTAMPDWPDAVKRPDYVQEMEEFEDEYDYQAPVAEIIPTPEPIFVKSTVMQGVEKSVSFQAPPQVASSVFAGTSNIRLPSVPLMKSTAKGRIDVNLRDRKKLKEAIVASLIFGPPRACDCSFDNTIAK